MGSIFGIEMLTSLVWDVRCMVIDAQVSLSPIVLRLKLGEKVLLRGM